MTILLDSDTLRKAFTLAAIDDTAAPVDSNGLEMTDWCDAPSMLAKTARVVHRGFAPVYWQASMTLDYTEAQQHRTRMAEILSYKITSALASLRDNIRYAWEIEQGAEPSEWGCGAQFVQNDPALPAPSAYGHTDGRECLRLFNPAERRAA